MLINDDLIHSNCWRGILFSTLYRDHGFCAIIGFSTHPLEFLCDYACGPWCLFHNDFVHDKVLVTFSNLDKIFFQMVKVFDGLAILPQ